MKNDIKSGMMLVGALSLMGCGGIAVVEGESRASLDCQGTETSFFQEVTKAPLSLLFKLEANGESFKGSSFTCGHKETGPLFPYTQIDPVKIQLEKVVFADADGTTIPKASLQSSCGENEDKIVFVGQPLDSEDRPNTTFPSNTKAEVTGNLDLKTFCVFSKQLDPL